MKRKSARKRLGYGKEGVLLSDILPYENPITFSNRQIFKFLKKNKINYDSEQNMITWKKKDRVLSELIRLLLGLPAGASSNASVQLTKFRTVPFVYKISHKDDDYRALTVVHPRNQLAVMEFYDRYKDTILYYCGLSPFSIRKPVRVARFVYYRDRLHRVTNAGQDSPGVIEQIHKEYENIKSFFVYAKYSNIYKFYESYCDFSRYVTH